MVLGYWEQGVMFLGLRDTFMDHGNITVVIQRE